MPTIIKRKEGRVSFTAQADGEMPSYSFSEAKSLVDQLTRDMEALPDKRKPILDPVAIYAKWNAPRPPGAERL